MRPEVDEIRVDDVPLSEAQNKVYYLLYKPTGCVTTLKDPQGRRTVLDWIPPSGVRVFPVGRLDYDAEGLLILTNDGALANRLQHPRYGVRKTYQVKVKGIPGLDVLKQLADGVLLEEGRTAPAQVRLLRRLPDAAWIEIVLHQGWYRQIKRMCGSLGYPVLKIKRIGYGPLDLGNMKPGQVRRLGPLEVKRLQEPVHQKREQVDQP